MPRERTMIRRNKSVSICRICGRIKLIISGSMYLKICEMLGGVEEKIYLCISLAASQHNNQAISLFCVRFAQTLHKIGGGSA